MFRNFFRVLVCFSIILAGRPLVAQPPTTAAAADKAGTDRFRLIGNGALALQAGEDVQSGAFGGMIELNRLELTLIATVSSNSAVATGRTTEDFATSLRPIRAGSTAGFVDARYRLISLLTFRGYFNLGNVEWVLQEDGPGGTAVETREDGSVMAGGVTGLVDLLGGRRVVDNRISLLVGGGYTWRGINGSLGTNEEFLTRTIGTTQTSFSGPELVALLRINDAEVALHVPFFRGDSLPDHLRGGEAFGSVNIIAGINIPLSKS